MTFDTETEHSGPPRVCDGPRLVRAEPALIKFVGGGTESEGGVVSLSGFQPTLYWSLFS